MEKEKRTERIFMKVLPSVKAAAEEKAAAEGRTLSNYIENLIKSDLEKENKMEKYYLKKYDSRMGGDYCEVYDENLKFIRTIKGASEVENLQEIIKRNSTIEAFLESEPLNDEFNLVTGHKEMTREQREQFTRNAIK